MIQQRGISFSFVYVNISFHKQTIQNMKFIILLLY